MKPILTIFSFFVAFTILAADTINPLGMQSSRLFFRTAFHSFNASENTANDIDIYALFFNAEGYLVDSVGVLKPNSGDHSAVHGGDAKKSGTETITLDLALVHPTTQMIALLITDHNKHGFNGLQNLDVGLFDSATQAAVARLPKGFHFHEANFTAFCFGVLSRSKDNGAWVFYNVPEFGYGKDLYSIVDEAYRSILRFTPLGQIEAGMNSTMQNPSSARMEKSRKVYIPVNFSNEIYIAAGWNINSYKAEEDDVDLDLNIHGFPSLPTLIIDKSQIATVYFGNKIYKSYNLGPIISLDKDNQTGDDQSNSTWGFGKNIFSTFDDEKIEIDLAKLQQDNKLSRLLATITVYNDGAKYDSIGFQCIESPFIRLLDKFGNQIAYFDLTALPAKKFSKKSRGKKTANKQKNDSKVFAYLAFEIVKDQYGWYFQMLDHIVPAKEGTTAKEINSHLLEFQKKREQKK